MSIQAEGNAYPRLSRLYLLRLLMLILYTMTGVLLLVMFRWDMIPSKPPLVLLLLGSCLSGLLFVRTSILSVLPRLMILIYYLPFSVTLVYLYDPNFIWWPSPRSYPSIKDDMVIRLAMLIGEIGLLGLLSGLFLSTLIRGRSTVDTPAPLQSLQSRKTLDPLMYGLFLAAGLFFSFLNTPAETILTLAYAAEGNEAISAQINFNAAFLFSYLILLLCYIDVEREKAGTLRKHVKFWALMLVILYILIFLQILRGNRDSAALVAGLSVLYLTGSGTIVGYQHLRTVLLQRVRRLILPLLLVVTVFIALGQARSALVRVVRQGTDLDPAETLMSGFSEITWTAVLLNNVSIARQYHDGVLEFLGGKTYLDYLFSLPPGFVTRALGIERPLESTQGPGWWAADIARGGIHIVLVPFKNFGISGAFVAMVIIGVLLGRLDRISMQKTFWSRMWYGTVASVAMHWFWYGDMYLIRAVMITAIIGLAYCFALPIQIRFSQRRPSEPLAIRP